MSHIMPLKEYDSDMMEAFGKYKIDDLRNFKKRMAWLRKR